MRPEHENVAASRDCGLRNIRYGVIGGRRSLGEVCKDGVDLSWFETRNRKIQVKFGQTELQIAKLRCEEFPIPAGSSSKLVTRKR